MRPDEQRQLEETSTDVDVIAREMRVAAVPTNVVALEDEMLNVWQRVQGNLGEPTALLDPELATAVDRTRGLFGRFFADEPGIQWTHHSDARNVDRLVRDALEVRVRDRAQEEVARGWRVVDLSPRELMSLGAVWRGTAAERIAGVRATQRMNTFRNGNYNRLGRDEQEDYRVAIASALPTATVLSSDRFGVRPLNADLARVTDPSLHNTMEMRLLLAYINATLGRQGLFRAEIRAIDAQLNPPEVRRSPSVEAPRYRGAQAAIDGIVRQEEARLLATQHLATLASMPASMQRANAETTQNTALTTATNESTRLRQRYLIEYATFIGNPALTALFTVPATPPRTPSARSTNTLRQKANNVEVAALALLARDEGTLTPMELLRRLVQRELQDRHSTLPPQEIEIRSIVATGLLNDRFLSDANPAYAQRQARRFTREGRNRDTYRDFDEFLNEAVFTDTDLAPLRGKLGLGTSVQDLSRLFSADPGTNLGADQLNKLIRLIDTAWSGQTAGEGQLNLAQDVRPLRQRLYTALVLLRARAAYDAGRTATPPATPSAAGVLNTILAEDLSTDLSSPPTLHSRAQAVIAGLIPATLSRMELALPLLVTAWHALQQRFRRRPRAAPTPPPVAPPAALPRPPAGTTPPAATAGSPARRRRRR